MIDRRDNNHREARAIRDRLVSERWHLFTSSFVLAETHALLLARLNTAIAAAYLRDVATSGISLLWVSAADVQRATDIIFAYDDKDFSLTDATSFAIMEREQIGDAFTFDHHFRQYGLAILSGG